MQFARFVHPWLAHLTLSGVAIALAVEFLPAFLCGALMEKRGRSNVVGFIVAFFLPVIGVLIICFYPLLTQTAKQKQTRRLAVPKGVVTRRQLREAMLPTVSADLKPCPSCKVPIPAQAPVCRVCQLKIDAAKENVA